PSTSLVFTLPLHDALPISVDRATRFAENQLKRGMFRNEGNWSAAARQLLDPTRWQSHGQMISWSDAADPSIGLTVEYLKPESETDRKSTRLNSSHLGISYA